MPDGRGFDATVGHSCANDGFCEALVSMQKQSGPDADRRTINVRDDVDVLNWCEYLGVSRSQLQAVVRKVGASAAAVEKELGF
jgi:hypothetical protein